MTEPVTQGELLQYLVDALDSLALPYMIVGSHASIYDGEPRFTLDVDLVIGLTPSAPPRFLERFPPSKFYVSEDAARDGPARRGQFNIIHGASGREDRRVHRQGHRLRSTDPTGALVTSPAWSPCPDPSSTSNMCQWARRPGVADLWDATRGHPE